MVNYLPDTTRGTGNAHTSARRILSLVVVMLGFTASLDVHAARFFRYIDENGRQVLSHTIPTERVKYGYQVVDEYANVIQDVPAQLSEEDYRAKLAREKAQAICEDALRRVQNLYQSLDDVDYAEQQALASIDTRVANTRANLAHVRNQKRELESQAAQIDIAGNTIPTTLLANIESAAAQEQTLEDEIELRAQEQEQLRKNFEADRIVFVLQTCDEGLPEGLASLN